MEMFNALNRRILVPLDDSSYSTHAIPIARGLASSGSTLILCRIVPKSPRLDDGGDCPAPIAGRARLDAEAALRAQVEQFVQVGDPRAEFVVAAGEPGECIVRIAREQSADMIVLASHGRSTGSRMLFGSVADDVLRAAPVPVVVVHPTDGEASTARGVRRLVVPIDESEQSHQAIPVAAALAKRRRLPVVLLSAADPAQVDAPIAGYAAAFSDRVYDDLMGSLRHDALADLERAGVRLMREGVVTTWRLLSGPPARVIPAVLSAGDLVVIAGRRLGPIEQWSQGSLAEELIHSGAAPVMVVGTTPVPAAIEPLAATESVSHA